MKKIIVLLTSFIMLTACGITDNGSYAKQDGGNFEETASEIAMAKTIFELKDRMTNTADWCKFSECDDDDEFAAYYDLLVMSGNSYIEVENNGSDYILFVYCYSDYGLIMENVNGIDKKYSDNTLSLELDKALRDVDNSGCAPIMSYCRCMIEIDEEFDNLTIDGKEYKKYDGGRIYIGEKYGMADGEFNIRVPVIYDQIMNFPVKDPSTENSFQYYRVCGADGNGIIDENYNTVLKPIYSNIIYIGENKYIVTKRKGESDGVEDYQIGVIDSDENIIHDYIDGSIYGSMEPLENYAHQVIFGRHDIDGLFEGVLNDNLEVIIEPKFKDVTAWCTDNENQFYVVENRSGEYAVIDSNGIQRTDFEKSSVYDVQTEYHEMLRTGTDKQNLY